MPIELNGTLVPNVQADTNSEDYTSSIDNLDQARSLRQKENIPGAQTAIVSNIEPMKQLFMPLIS